MTPEGTQPKIMGILNVTPDSFSDGGKYLDPDFAAHRLDQLFEEGSDLVDIGAESTRPGADDPGEVEEWRRLHPVLAHADKVKKISRVSVDTRKFATMARASAMGVGMINNVGPLPEVPQLKNLFELNPNLMFIACHMHGSPKTMQENPIGPASAIKRVRAYFDSASEDLKAAGCKPHHIFLDPGIGFGKSDSANLALLMASVNLSREFQTVLGISRKGFITRLLDATDIASRDSASKVIEACAALVGVKMIRTHNVRSLRPILSALADASPGAFHG